MADWSSNYKSLLDSDFGKELIRSLRENLVASLIQEAQNAETPEEAFGLIKESSGVIKAIAHLKFNAVSPKSGGKSDN